MKKRLLSIVLALSLVLGMLPMSAFAAEVDPHGLCTEGHVHTEECGTCAHEHTTACYPKKLVKSDWQKCVKGETCEAFYNTGWELAHRINFWDDCIWGPDLNDIYGGYNFSILYQYRYIGDDWNCNHTHGDDCFKGCGMKEGDGAGHHVWPVDKAVVVEAATCEAEGTIKYVCGNNADHFYYDTIPATGATKSAKHASSFE